MTIRADPPLPLGDGAPARRKPLTMAKAVGVGDLESTQMPMPRDKARAIGQRERRRQRGW